MNKAKPVLRILLGVLFLIFSLNFFFHFLPMPSPTDPRAQAFMGGLFGTGYFFQFLKVVELVCAIMLITNMYVALALIILAPIVINIFLYHAMLAPEGVPLALFLGLLLAALGYMYRGSYREVLKKKA